MSSFQADHMHEKLAMQQARELPPGHRTLNACAGPQPALQWAVPALLDERCWPEVKGDFSTERDLQRERHSNEPERVFRGVHAAEDLVEVPATGMCPPGGSLRPKGDSGATHIPFERVEDGSDAAASTEPASAQAAEPLPYLLGREAGGLKPPTGPSELNSRGVAGTANVSNNMGTHAGGGATMGLNRLNAPGMSGCGGTMCNSFGANPAYGNTAQQAMGGGGLTEKLMLHMMMQNNVQQPLPSERFNRPRSLPAPPQGMHQTANQGFNFGRRDDGFEPEQHPKYRTKPCRYFATPGGCKNGSRCTFLHLDSASPGELGMQALAGRPLMNDSGPGRWQ